MISKPSLAILAAGVGSRYGGLKQLDKFTPEGDTIMDFSIYDAIQAGFGKIVFVISKEMESDCREIYQEKIGGKIPFELVFQELKDVPSKYYNPERRKPWGTGQALLAAKNSIHENFAIINADDFYGKEAFKIMAKALVATDESSLDFKMISYKLKNTVSEHGYVSRGECQVNDKGYLRSVTERTHIEKLNGKFWRKDEQEKITEISGDTIVSMNFWGFTPRCFDIGEKLFETFLASNYKEPKTEFYIPSIANEALNKGGSVQVLNSNAVWFGVTYQEDKKHVEKEISLLREKGFYPKNLWYND